MKIMAQGDPVEYDVADPADACRLYRQDMTAALIGVVTHVTDYERAKRNAESVRLMNELQEELDQARADLARLKQHMGIYAFQHRHYALSYVRRANPELHDAAVNDALRRMDAGDRLTYQDYVTQVEEERDAAQADAAALRDAIIDYLECPTCHGEGIHWTDVLGEAEPEQCDRRNALDVLIAKERP